LDAWGRPEEEQAVMVVASWSYVGSGYQTTGGGMAGCLGGCSGSGSAADRQGGTTYQDDRGMTSGRETTAKAGRLWRSCC